MNCPTSAATSSPSSWAKPSTPASWGMSGWNSSSGRTLCCWSGFPRKGMPWTWTSSGPSCCPPR
eukprot:949407-Alexandrium_andersonii.AAC.1